MFNTIKLRKTCMSKTKTEFFAMRLKKSTIRKFKRSKRGTADSFISELLDQNSGNIMSRNRPAKASQSAQIAPDRVSKRRVGVLEGGME